MKKHKHNSGGYVVLITVLILGIVLSTIATFLLLTGSNASITAESVDGNIEARSAATGCAELALEAIQTNPTLSTPSNGSETISSSNESCTYSISGISPSYTILATGNVTEGYYSLIHNLTITTTQTTPTITISSWQDTP